MLLGLHLRPYPSRAHDPGSRPGVNLSERVGDRRRRRAVDRAVLDANRLGCSLLPHICIHLPAKPRPGLSLVGVGHQSGMSSPYSDSGRGPK
jgi:hypothetical protein